MSNDPSPLVDVSDVSHAYGDRTVVEHVDWCLKRGDRWAVIGPSGAGKTTLLKIAAGYLWPNAGGTVRREGEERLNLSVFRRSVGWLSEELLEKIPRRQTVLETLLAGVFSQSRLAERKDLQLTEENREEARRLCRQLGLKARRRQAFGTLSQGEKQLNLVGRALMGRPRLIVLDEPCAGMDPGSRERFLGVLRRLVESEPAVSFVYITHHVEEILPPFDRTLALRAGTVMTRGPTDTVLTSSRMSRLYGTPLGIERRGDRYVSFPRV